MVPHLGARHGRRVIRVPELRRAYSNLDHEERLSLTAKLFCEGKSPSQIQKHLAERFEDENIRREEPYRLLQLASALGYFHYRPPLEPMLAAGISQEWDLAEAHVVQTAMLDHVASRAAAVLLDLIQQEWAAKQTDYIADQARPEAERDEEAGRVRVGLAGGRTVLGIVRALVDLLKLADPDSIPPELVFHTACTGIDYSDPSTDPNAFISHLLRVPGVDTRTSAVPYQAPPIMRPEVRAMLEAEPDMRKAARSFKDVHILVTAGSSWRIMEILGSGEIGPAPDHERERERERAPDRADTAPLSTDYSQLKTLMLDRDKRGYNDLIRAGTVGDMLWQPLTFRGPAEIETKVKVMTLAPLSSIPDFIEQGKKVLFALGPYDAGFDKGDVLLAALGGGRVHGGYSAPPLFTHLVCDHRTARAVLKVARR